jgi:hypothetical protein
MMADGFFSAPPMQNFVQIPDFAGGVDLDEKCDLTPCDAVKIGPKFGGMMSYDTLRRRNHLSCK